MDYAAELCRMRKRYAASHMKGKLPRPSWLGKDDELNLLFNDTEKLFSEGIICYGSIVQANTLLFSRKELSDCPASFIFSTDEIMEDKADILSGLAHNIFLYKDNYDYPVPDDIKGVIDAVRDEYDRSSFSFRISAPDAEIFFVTTIVFRTHIPMYVLKGSIVPMLIAPDRKTAIILPMYYWSPKMRLKYAFGGLY